MSEPTLNQWNGISEDTEFDKKYFLDTDMSYSETNDTQKACHTSGLGSITILDRLTGFGEYIRDVETGYRDKHGEFWLASGNFNILEEGCKTFGEAIALIKKNANNCIGKEHEDKFPIQRVKKAEEKLKKVESAWQDSELRAEKAEAELKEMREILGDLFYSDEDDGSLKFSIWINELKYDFLTGKTAPYKELGR